jgi:TRAP-type C4-dicarboxylate transport system permease small subunit
VLGRLLATVENALLVILLGALIGVATYQVVLRNVFDSGLLWGDALVRVVVLWIALAGAMVGTRRGLHIRMDVVARFVAERRQRALSQATAAFASIVCLVVAWHSLRFVVYEYEDQIIAFSDVPAWVCEAIMPLAFLVMGLRYVVQVFQPPQPNDPSEATFAGASEVHSGEKDG